MRHNQGQIMIICVTVMGSILLVATVIAGMLLRYQIRQASDMGNTVKAICAADTGIEWELYKLFKDQGYPKPVLSNGATFSSETTTPAGTVARVKSTGESSKNYRTLEVIVTRE